MDNRELLQKSIDYIEENLKTEIVVHELSSITGFSLFYYYRIFQNTIGMPIMQYVTRRKLLNAIYEIDNGEKMVEVALAYGFETYAGFYKAFRREFLFSPSTYLKKHKVKKPYRVNLFEEKHIMITHKKVVEVLKNWNLDNEKVSDVYYEGTDNRNNHAFYIGNDYVLKFSANLGALKNHIDISKELDKMGFSAAVAIYTMHGDEFIQDGELYACLSKRIKGKQMKSCDMYEGDYKSKARFIGEILGQLHLILKEFDIAVHENDLLLNLKNWALPKNREILSLNSEFLDVFIVELERLFPTLQKQIVHRDPNPSNIIVNGDNFGFVDFDLTERNVRIYDICYASTAILSETVNDLNSEKLDKWISIYKNIIYGYDDVAKLSDNERKAVPYIIIANQLICMAWFSQKEKYQEQYQANTKMTKWLIDNFDNLLIG